MLDLLDLESVDGDDDLPDLESVDGDSWISAMVDSLWDGFLWGPPLLTTRPWLPHGDLGSILLRLMRKEVPKPRKARRKRGCRCRRCHYHQRKKCRRRRPRHGRNWLPCAKKVHGGRRKWRKK